MIDCSTQLLGVIGDPINHSLSPAMQNFVIQKLGLNFCYHAFHVKQPDLQQTVQSFKLLNFRGINVTLPHKQAIRLYVNEISEEARYLGAVNTVLFENNRAFGYNTDVIGFLKSLGEFRATLKEKTAIIIGAGGSARAVTYALIKDGIGQIKIFNRTAEKIDELQKQMRVATLSDRICAIPFSKSALSQEIQGAAIIINTTPIGMYPEVDASPVADEIEFVPGTLVYNLIYNPLETKLLKKARSAGAFIRNGLDMLIYQGLESLKIWTGAEIKIDNIVPELREFLMQKITSTL